MLFVRISLCLTRSYSPQSLHSLRQLRFFFALLIISILCIFVFRNNVSLSKIQILYIDVVVVMLFLLDLNDFYPNVFSQLNQFHFSVFATNHNNNNKKILFSIIRSCLKYHFEKPAIANCTVGLIHKSKQLLYVLSHCKYLKNRLVNRKFNRFFSTFDITILLIDFYLHSLVIHLGLNLLYSIVCILLVNFHCLQKVFCNRCEFGRCETIEEAYLMVKVTIFNIINESVLPINSGGFKLLMSEIPIILSMCWYLIPNLSFLSHIQKPSKIKCL